MEHPEKNSETPEKPINTQKLSQKSVMHYLAVLFGAAFCLLLLTYMMERRTTEATMDVLSGYMENIIDDKGNLEAHRDSLLTALDMAEEQVTTLEDQLEDLQLEYDRYTQTLQDQLEEAQSTIQMLEEAVAATQAIEELP